MCFSTKVFNLVNKTILMCHCLSIYTAAPVIDPPPLLLLIGINSSFTLNCTSRGSPPDTFTWVKDNSVALPSSIITVDYNSTTAVFRSEYYIERISTDDSGLYNCTVSNPLGSDSATIAVINAGKCLHIFSFFYLAI